MDGWILQSTAPDRVHETMNEGPARSSTCEPAPHACRLHGPTMMDVQVEACARGTVVECTCGGRVMALGQGASLLFASLAFPVDMAPPVVFGLEGGALRELPSAAR
jgi:hypothetical protein